MSNEGRCFRVFYKSYPFVWENTWKHKDELYFEILGRRGIINYSIFKELTKESASDFWPFTLNSEFQT